MPPISDKPATPSEENNPKSGQQPQNASSPSGQEAANPWEADKQANQTPAPALPAEAPSPVLAQPPVELAGLRTGKAAAVAGGIPAILQSAKHAWGEMGVLKGTQVLLRMNQKDGFDCPGCAWPDPDGHRAAAEFCENGAKNVADEATTSRATPDFFARHSLAELSRLSDYELNKTGRLTHPLVLREGSQHYEPISWEDAFALIGQELNVLTSPDEATFYTSGRTSNEAAFLYQLFVRQFGTNNLPDCSNLCHESSGTALTQTLGLGKGSVTLHDFDEADVILIIGQNPGTNHPRMLSTLQQAKRRGAKIISVNPLPETGLQKFTHPQEVFQLVTGQGTTLTDLFLQVRINGDMAVLWGLAKLLVEAEDQQPASMLDGLFMASSTEGAAAYLEHVRKTSWEEILESSGLRKEQLQEAAELLKPAQKIITCWAMGLTQHKNAVATIQEIVNLHLLKGAIGIPGAGVCPVRGHSNVQGDRTMGIWERPSPAFLEALGREFAFQPPAHHGLDVVESIKAMLAGRVKVFIGLGGNFLSATPDTELTARALRNCRLTVQVSTKPNRSHLVTGRQALILPCLGRTEQDVQAAGEQFVSVENSMGVVQSSRGSFAPASRHLLSEPAIVAGMALATLGSRSTVDWAGLVQDYDRIRNHISRVVPGFSRYNERVRQPGGFYLPNGPRERRFTTPSGKARFTCSDLPRHRLRPGELVMMSVRSHDQFNTTIFGLQDRYRGIYGGRRVIFLHPDDVREQGLQAGHVVNIRSHFAGEERVAHSFVVVPFPIPRGNAATYYPETNVLFPLGSVADKSNQATFKFVVVTLEKVMQGEVVG
jgi:molybdopterin-dependent oxidoreductase alpha subunit